MTIAEKIYSMLTNDADITNEVSTRVYHQTTDLVSWQFDSNLPLITFARLTVNYNRNTKKLEPRQITIRAGSLKKADEIVELVKALFDETVTDTYRFCKLRFSNTIYDKDYNAHGVALTFDFINQLS